MRRYLPYLPPALLVLVAVTQFAVAKTTSLTPWKLGGFGMFSTSDHPMSRVLRVTVETEDGAFVVPGPVGDTETLTWPRPPALLRLAQGAACGHWRLVPLDSAETVVFPTPEWSRFYRVPAVREQTELAGFAIAEREPSIPHPEIRSARASVYWIRLDTAGAESVLRSELVAAETVTPAEAGCPPAP